MGYIFLKSTVRRSFPCIWNLCGTLIVLITLQVYAQRISWRFKHYCVDSAVHKIPWDSVQLKFSRYIRFSCQCHLFWSQLSRPPANFPSKHTRSNSLTSRHRMVDRNFDTSMKMIGEIYLARTCTTTHPNL